MQVCMKIQGSFCFPHWSNYLKPPKNWFWRYWDLYQWQSILMPARRNLPLSSSSITCAAIKSWCSTSVRTKWESFWHLVSHVAFWLASSFLIVLDCCGKGRVEKIQICKQLSLVLDCIGSKSLYSYFDASKTMIRTTDTSDMCCLEKIKLEHSLVL